MNKLVVVVLAVDGGLGDARASVTEGEGAAAETVIPAMLLLVLTRGAMGAVATGGSCNVGAVSVLRPCGLEFWAREDIGGTLSICSGGKGCDEDGTCCGSGGSSGMDGGRSGTVSTLAIFAGGSAEDG